MVPATVLAAIVATAIVSGGPSDPGLPSAILCRGPNLLVDDGLIAESRGLIRTTHQPQKLPNPVLRHDRPMWFLEVLYDADLARYRMWYNAMGPRLGYAYAESEDAIRWSRPSLGFVPWPDGSNYIDAPMGNWSLFLRDEGARFADPARRYKMAYYVQGRAKQENGLCVAFSADGLRFRPFEGNPVLPEDVLGDIIDGCWDPLKGEYLLACKFEQSGYPGKPHYLQEGKRRVVAQATSPDFLKWNKPSVILTPNPAHGIEEFYGLKPRVRGNLYLGFLRVLRDDLPATPGGPVEGIGWTELMTSRDGHKWTRHPDKFLDRDPREDRWDHAMAWFGDCLTVGDKDYIYFGGYRAGHKIRSQSGDRSVGMAILRKNGFVSRDAGREGGVLKIRLAALPGDHLTVNAHVRGELRIRLLDENDQVVPGFDWDDCIPVRGDSVAHLIQWRGNPQLPRDRRFSLVFSLIDTELYGFDFVDAGRL